MPTVLLLPALLSGPDVSTRVDTDAWETGARRVELRAEASGESVEVRVSPGVGTLLLFDSPPSRVEVEARQHFRGVGLEGAMLTLVPDATFQELGQARVTAHFTDGAAPATAAFLLRVVPPALAERQVEVHRRSRGLESYVQENRELRSENEALRREVARLQAMQAHPDGLAGLLASGVMTDKGVVARDVTSALLIRPRDTLSKVDARAFRSTQRVALELLLENSGAQPWRAAGAALQARAGAVLKVLRVWQPVPIAPGEQGYVTVEAENAPQVAQGPFTLTLWEEGTRHPITLGNITFP
ncbi:DUF2381 family protein [Pyxidicoccus sp. QH1ED-7-1]|nr:DUF2381 family protein [Pyxidicoccus xibeiensis]